MKTMILTMLAMLAMLGTCQSKGAQQAAEGHVTTVTGQLSATEVENKVRDIYATVFREYIIEDSLRNLGEPVGEGAYGKRKQFNADYCTRGLNDLFRQVDEIDSLYHSGEMGFFDADYWIMAQDYGSDLKVSDVRVVSMNGNEAVVEMQLHNLNTSKPVRLKMLHEDGTWRIDSFVDVNSDYDMKRSMEEYITEENKQNKQ